jgi:disulfide bond formation protein DsbB
MHATPSVPPRPALLLVLLASAAIVGAALLFQYVGGLAPCELCLYERWPWYAALVIAAAALASGSEGVTRAALALCFVVFAAGSALAVYHVGVEQHWIAGPTACTGSGTGAQTIAELKAQLLGRQPVNCDEPAWRLFGVSLAGFNLLASLAVALFCAAVARRPTRRYGFAS